MIASRTWGVTPVVSDDGIPFGLVTGSSLFKLVNRFIGPNPNHQNISLTKVLEIPCAEAANTKIPRFQANIRIRDPLNRIFREEGDDFFVVDEKVSGCMPPTRSSQPSPIKGYISGSQRAAAGNCQSGIGVTFWNTRPSPIWKFIHACTDQVQCGYCWQPQHPRIRKDRGIWFKCYTVGCWNAARLSPR